MLAGTLVLPALSEGTAGSEGWAPLVREIEQRHPGVEAQRELIRSLEELPEVRMAWDDPVIGVGLNNLPVDSFRFNREAMTQKTVSVTQRVPSVRKRAAEMALAESDVDVAKARERLLISNLVTALKKTVFEIAYMKRALEILSDNEVILDEFVRIANAKYASGKGIQANVIQAQVERSKIMDRKLKLRERLRLAETRANRILGRDPSSVFEASGASLDMPVELTLDDLWSKTRESSPDIKLAEAMMGRSVRKIEKAEGELGMNMAFSAMYGQRDDTPMNRPDFFSVNAQVSVPLWRSSKQDRLIASAKAGATEAKAMARDVEQEVRTKLAQAVISYEKEWETIELYRNGIIPQAEQALESARAAYQLDRLDFLSLLSNEITLLQYELELEMAVFRRRSLYAEIESLTGAALAPGGGIGKE